eukprot:CAMPEP_0178464338 /NCGR_PEP_ID=MMETSP0689_2-20121128/50790_1 /TAXON_ID=160604 /ORGANISM="Amphidinium massartii, Strain CS-259" /LENGTH=178 /DNA_ID=CAMNT_0020091235 /DNA_START=18 /DNA_END=552 /DNA_ORIENTATION=-
MDSQKYSGKALIKVISFDRELVHGFGESQQTLERFGSYDLRMPLSFKDEMNLECQRLGYSEGLWYSYTNSRQFMAVVDGNSDLTPSNYLSFTGTTQQEAMQVQQAGVVAVCYCGMVTPDDVCLDTDWLFVSRLTIRGPRGGDSWVFLHRFGSDFLKTGWGLSDEDKIRIVPATSQCTD